MNIKTETVVPKTYSGICAKAVAPTDLKELEPRVAAFLEMGKELTALSWQNVGRDYKQSFQRAIEGDEKALKAVEHCGNKADFIRGRQTRRKALKRRLENYKGKHFRPVIERINRRLPGLIQPVFEAEQKHEQELAEQLGIDFVPSANLSCLSAMLDRTRSIVDRLDGKIDSKSGYRGASTGVLSIKLLIPRQDWPKWLEEAPL